MIFCRGRRPSSTGSRSTGPCPSVPEVPDAAKISMIVVIKKTGELDSIEILEGTSVEALDRAALDALRASLPFPALPADFPGDLLEITFEFVYND